MNSLIPSFLQSFVKDMFFRKMNYVAPQKEFAPSKLFARNVPSQQSHLLPGHVFGRMLLLERKRTERSRNPFLLVSMKMGIRAESSERWAQAESIVEALLPVIRETDIFGWLEDETTVGIICTSIAPVEDSSLIVDPIRTKILEALTAKLGASSVEKLLITFQLFPEEAGKDGHLRTAKLYENLPRSQASTWLESRGKRALDIMGSFLALTFLLPVFVVLALAVKLTSKGPVFFRQQRIGRQGIPFTFLKFRSMYTGNNPQIHQEYVAKFIKGEAAAAQGGVFKLTADPRVTPLGRFLRKTSLDELPQFWNVLRGDMSLVGPRPPVPYELEAYDLWHRARVLDVRPGITGLWQVNGRSSIRFDDMVRLDLRYKRTSSLALDLKILWRTPRVVVLGDGAY